jgi:hypothetical protein
VHVEREPPLVPTAVDGWRVWRLTTVHGRVRLAAVTRDTLWLPLEPARARCPQHGETEVPGADCMCGLYAASSLRSLRRAGVLRNAGIGAVGVVGMWGRLVQHDRGSRSAIAYPARLRLLCGRCLAERRGAVDPVGVIPSGDDLRPVCARHLPAGARARDAAGVQAELLDAYAVELLPRERVARSLGHRRGVGALLRRLDGVPSLPARLLGPARLVVALTSVIVLALLGSGLWAARDGGAVRGVAATSFTVTNVVPRSIRTVSLLPPSESRPRSVALCGIFLGGTIQRVDCHSVQADLVGIASSPPAPRSRCDGDGERYVRSRTWSVCWMSSRPRLARVGVRAVGTPF